jgi:hypothetical protein
MTYFKPKNMGDVHVSLGGLADDVPVTLGPGVLLPDVRTVRDLRALRAWSKGYRLVVERHPLIEVRVELP